jgi:hypothetical protein
VPFPDAVLSAIEAGNGGAPGDEPAA